MIQVTDFPLTKPTNKKCRPTYLVNLRLSKDKEEVILHNDSY
jgi:hypothetical protein